VQGLVASTAVSSNMGLPAEGRRCRQTAGHQEEFRQGLLRQRPGTAGVTPCLRPDGRTRAVLARQLGMVATVALARWASHRMLEADRVLQRPCQLTELARVFFQHRQLHGSLVDKVLCHHTALLCRLCPTPVVAARHHQAVAATPLATAVGRLSQMHVAGAAPLDPVRFRHYPQVRVT